MKTKYIKKGNLEYKVAYEFEINEEIIEGIPRGFIDPFLNDAETLEHDRYSLNVISGAVITDAKERIVVATGYVNINKFMKEHNLVSIVDIIELEN